MIEVSALTFTLLSEGFAVLCLIFVVMIVLMVRKKKKDKDAAKILVDSIKTNAAERLDNIKSIINTLSGLENDELALAAKTIDRKEKDFFTHLVRSYIKRDATLFSEMAGQYDSVIEAYKVHAGEMNNSDSQDDAKTEQIEALTETNTRLMDELNITKSTMANMMAEFNTMFKGGSTEAQQDSKEALQSSMVEAEPAESDGDEIEMAENDEQAVTEAPAVEEPVAETPVAPAEPEPQAAAEDDVEISNDDLDDIFSAATPDPTAPKSISESDDNDGFGDIVSSEDVDDLFDSIDLSKEID